MDQAYIGSIVIFAGTFAPRGWAFCQGQLMSIAQNTALFSILGTTYGGDGRTTFGLPNLQSRVPINAGQGPGLSSYALGQQGGEETVTLIAAQMPMHNHLVGANENAAGNDPKNSVLANDARGPGPAIYAAQPDGTLMNPQMIGTAGGNQPHDNMPPYLAVNYIICVEGLFPPRN